MCRCFAFHGCAVIYIAAFPPALRWGKAQRRRRRTCHTASADLKELPSADLHGLLLVSTLSRDFYFAVAAAKVQN
jgi:hypothetical protein